LVYLLIHFKITNAVKIQGSVTVLILASTKNESIGLCLVLQKVVSCIPN